MVQERTRAERLRRGLTTFGALAGLLALGWQVVRAEGEQIPSPGALAYRGTLEQDGVPFDGTATFTLRLYDTAAMDNELCSAELAAPVTAGRFVVELPDACEAAVRRNSEAWLAVTADVGDGPQAFPIQRLHAVPYAVSAANGVPVGGVVPYFLDPATHPLPPGFEVCDGSEITDERSPLMGETKPDLRGRFLRGVNDDFAVGSEGGRDIGATAVSKHKHEWSRIGAQSVLGGRITFHDVYLADGTARRYAERLYVGSEPGRSAWTFPEYVASSYRPQVDDEFYTQVERRVNDDGTLSDSEGHFHAVDVRPAFTSVVYICRIF